MNLRRDNSSSTPIERRSVDKEVRYGFIALGTCILLYLVFMMIGRRFDKKIGGENRVVRAGRWEADTRAQRSPWNSDVVRREIQRRRMEQPGGIQSLEINLNGRQNAAPPPGYEFQNQQQADRTAPRYHATTATSFQQLRSQIEDRGGDACSASHNHPRNPSNLAVLESEHLTVPPPAYTTHWNPWGEEAGTGTGPRQP